MTVSLFVTCLVDQLFPQVAFSTLEILKHLGVEARFDPRQTCCSQPAFNSGYRREARQVARHFLEVFEESEKLVVPSGSCTSMIKVFLPGLFAPQSEERRRAEQIAGRTHELSEFLTGVLGVESTGARFQETVTYHDSCHSLRELGIADGPRRLIRNVEGIDFREMEAADRCCGFGGTFSVMFEDVSCAIGEDKLKAIERCGARYVVATDVSCLMHLDGLLRRKGLAIQTMHLAELLAQNLQ